MIEHETHALLNHQYVRQTLRGSTQSGSNLGDLNYVSPDAVLSAQGRPAWAIQLVSNGL